MPDAESGITHAPGDDPVIRDDHCPIMQRCVGIKDLQQQFWGNIGVQTHPGARILLQRDRSAAE